MNISKIAEAFGYIDDRFLKEAELPQKRHFKFKPTLLAAIISIVALSTSVAAISYGGNLRKMKYAFDRFSGIQGSATLSTDEEASTEVTDLTPNHTADYEGDYSYYSDLGEEIPDPSEFPWLEGLENCGVELEAEGELEAGQFRATAVMCDEHYFCAVIQYAMPDEAINALKDIPNGKPPQFESNHFYDCGGYEGIIPISLEGDIFTFSVFSSGFLSLADEVEIVFKNFGYKPIELGWEFITLYEMEEHLIIPTAGIKRANNRTSKATAYPTEHGNIYITAELSPLGIMLSFTGENHEGAEEVYSDKYFGSNNLRIHLTDGRIYGSGETYWALSNIISGKSGFIENIDDTDPANRIYYINLPFIKPVDIYKIEKLSLGSIEFTFEG